MSDRSSSGDEYEESEEFSEGEERSEHSSESPPSKRPKLSRTLPTEIIAEILKYLCQYGPRCASKSLLIGKVFNSTLSIHIDVDVRWSDLDAFNEKNRKQPRRFLRHLKIDFSISSEEEQASTTYSMDNLLKSISEIDVKAHKVTFIDFMTRMHIHPVPLKFSFSKSIKHMTCIESGNATDAERLWQEHGRPQVPEDVDNSGDDDEAEVNNNEDGEPSNQDLKIPFIRRKVGNTEFTKCKDLFWDLSDHIRPSSHWWKVFTFYDDLEHLYVILPRTTTYSEHSIMSKIIDLNVLHKRVEKALIILTEEEEATAFEKEMEQLYKGLIETGRDGWTIQNCFFRYAVVLFIPKTKRDSLNSPEGKEEIRRLREAKEEADYQERRRLRSLEYDFAPSGFWDRVERLKQAKAKHQASTNGQTSQQ